jgi:hypothetical protein
MSLPIQLLILVAVFLAGLGSGVKLEANHRDAQALVVERSNAEAFRQSAAEQRKTADRIGAELNKAQAQREGDKRAFDAKLAEAKRENQLGKCVPVSAPSAAGGEAGAAGNSGFDLFVNAGVWNAALAIGTGPGGDPGPADAGAGGPYYAPLGDALGNLGENSAKWARCRDTLKKWQALAVEKGWWTPQ